MPTFWVHSRMLMAIDVPQLSPHSASLPFCLRLWSPRIWPHTLCLQFLFSQVHSARCCQTNHPKTCLCVFFLQVTSLVREIAAILCLPWDEVQIWHQIPSQTSTSVFLKFFSVLNIPLQWGVAHLSSHFSSIYSLKKQLLNVNCMPGVLTGNGNTNLIETWSLTRRSSQSDEEENYICT